MNREAEEQITKVFDRMCEEETDTGRIHHFIKVHNFARQIASCEKVSDHDRLIIETAALVHDIGIGLCLEKYGSSAGSYQEFEGPGLAGDLLYDLGFEDDVIDRVCWLVSRHHTYTDVEQIDHRILLEADALVNAMEERWSEEAKDAAYGKVFETETGKKLFQSLYANA